MYISKTQKPVAAILLPDSPNDFHRFLGEELQAWILKLSGARLPVHEASAMPDGVPFVSVAGAGLTGKLPDTTGLDAEGFILRTLTDGGREAVLCLGREETGTMYAVYELLERLGIVFQMTETLIPETRADLSVPPLDLACSPQIKNRGYTLGMMTAQWIGFKEFKQCIDQMARMKLNHVMFWNGISAPFLDIEVRGEKNLLGDQNAPESGYLAWRCSTGTHTVEDITIGREHFSGPRVCGDEFQYVRTAQEAKTVAKALLNRMIDYAHSRKVRLSIGICDLPCIPINLARHRKHPMNATPWYGAQPSPSEPIVEETWRAILDTLLRDYPRADGLWIWISEAHRQYQDAGYKAMASEFREKYGHLVKSLEEIKAAGMWRPTTDAQLDSDFAYLHLAQRLVAEARANHPGRTLGISWCGRLYLFEAMDAIFPKDVPLLSLEACICWCRETRVPMEWGQLEGRETWLVPRLDDDVNSFGPQWNVGLYRHDRVLEGSKAFGFDGVLAQVCSRLRGLEHNADFLARGYWNPELNQEDFYRGYTQRVFGDAVAESLFQGFMTLERFEKFLGRDARVPHGGMCFFSGLSNFIMYNDSHEVRAMSQFRDLKQPFEGPRFPGNWDVGRYEAESPVAVKSALSSQETDSREKRTAPAAALDPMAFEGYDDLLGGDDAKFIENCIYRRGRFLEALPLLRAGRMHFEAARERVPPGARNELDYMLFKIEMFDRHISWIVQMLDTWLAMDRAFARRARDDRSGLCAALDEMMARYDEGLGILRGTLRRMAASPHTADPHTADPSERYMLFRYHARFLNPAEAFRTFLANLRNFHHGEAPYWEPVAWERIRMTQWMEM